MEDAPVLVEAERTIASRPGFLASRPEELLEANFRSMMLTSLIDWARAAPRIRKIELNVRATNTRAIGLYRSLGFEEQGRQLQRICIDEQTFLDDLEMGLFVKPAMS